MEKEQLPIADSPIHHLLPIPPVTIYNYITHVWVGETSIVKGETTQPGNSSAQLFLPET